MAEPKVVTPVPPLSTSSGEASGIEPAGAHPQEMPPIADEPLPRRLGKYILFRKLATGGMAELFLAIQRSVAGFEKVVVVKRILPHVAQDTTFIQMLLREARIAATLNHPNIAQIFDVGEANGSYFIAMEYVHGEDLRSIVRQMKVKGHTSFAMEHAVSIVMGLAAGLDYAHARRDLSGQPLEIVHRDVSPQNVLVTFTGDIKIVDFGIAVAGRSGMEATEQGKLRGKIPYMSPEQAKGDPLDGRSDIFSAGVLLFELTTGKRLFRGPNEFETLRMIVESTYPTPRQARPSIPETLDAIIRKTLEKDREKRYQTAGELQRDLEAFIRDHRVAASSLALGSFMRSIFEEHLVSQDQALQEGKRLADELELTEPEVVYSPPSGSQSLTNIPAVAAAPDVVPVAPAPSGGGAKIAIVAAVLGLALIGLALLGWKLLAPGNAGVATGPGSIVVTSEPRGAAVWLDGEATGKRTPARLERLPVDATYTVRVTAENMEPATQQVRLTSDRREATVNARLVASSARALAVIRVTSTPSGARILFDGRDTGRRTPSTLDSITPGVPHQIMLVRDGYADRLMPVTLQPGQVESLDMPLERAPLAPGEALLLLTVEPPTARVEINGTALEGTDARELRTTQRSLRIAATAPGHEDERRVLRLDSGQTRELRLSLRRSPERVAVGGTTPATPREPTRPERPERPETPAPSGPGRLTFGAVPWCNVTIDGRRVGQTPIVNHELSAGNHTLVCQNPELGVTRTITVHIDPGQTARRRIVLQQASQEP
ncbi:MAG: serine/threonine protein kinase [Deltaproteobacteria bacterium]|nr:serine/threonine protein kinase [Deltaproteobacteria bacterium]